MTIYLSASDTVISTKDVKTRHALQPDDKAELDGDEEEPPARISRSQSYQSYGTIEFGQSRRSARQYSVDSIASAPLLAGAGTSEQPPPQPIAPRKVMYFAAGSGIPEIKTLLGGFVIRGYLGGWTL